MPYPTLPRRFLDAVDKFHSPRAQMYRTENGWEEVPAHEVLRRVAGLSAGLEQIGVKPGDRVGLLAPNRPEWHIADLAILGLGAADVPVYFGESLERMVYILNHSGARVVFAVGSEQVRRLLQCREQLPSVEKLICADAPPEAGSSVMHYESLIADTGELELQAYRRRVEEIKPEQLATIIYTSGTTGEPKGVMLTHDNFSSNVQDGFDLAGFDPGRDRALSFLPLAHVYERVADYDFLFAGVPLAYVEDVAQVVPALIEIRPTLLAAVPRFFEKLYSRVLEQGHACRGFRRKVFDWALALASEAIPWRAHGEPASLKLKLRWALANALVYRKIRAGMGGCLRIVFSGGAPLSKELAEVVLAFGLPVYQGYGLTETSPVVTSNYPDNRVGSVGKPIPNVKVRIAADGEIQVHGPCVMQGYYRKPEETRAVLSSDGWLSTGDIGYLDSDGFLYVTDRKKELLKTAAGKFVAPQPIENLLKSSPFILNAAVIGDRRRFISALIVPNFDTLEALAREQGCTSGSREELASSDWVRECIEREVGRLCGKLASYETIKRFALLPEDFSFNGGELTYTLKLKRRIVEQKYQNVIDSLYLDAEADPHQTASHQTA
ncbi:MAG TPA: long-chain fatty acid--CoA ligase [Methylomirabilota bacterium]|nr:long-chain fatty acid--CoA ligase [Methylomirabilota bacterium]